MNRLVVLAGARIGFTTREGQTVRLGIGVGWEFGQLVLRGYRWTNQLIARCPSGGWTLEQ